MMLTKNNSTPVLFTFRLRYLWIANTLGAIRGVSMRIMLAAFLMMFLSRGIAAEGSYLACTGHSGMSPKQDLIPLLNRTITTNDTLERGAIFVEPDKIAVEGIPWMIGDYKMCENSGQVIIFSYYCNLPEGKDREDGMQVSMGILNKVTGDVRFNRGEQLFILKCHKAEKVVK